MNKKVRVHAAKSASGWTLETVDASSDVGRDASMVLDAQGRPHIVIGSPGLNLLPCAVEDGAVVVQEG